MTQEEKKESKLHKALCLAAEKGELETVRRLLAEGANVDGGEYEGAPLAHAADEGQLEVMRFLLDAGAKADCWDDRGGSALYNAACSESLDCVRLLLESGAHIAESVGPCEQTPLQEAARQSNIPMVQLLLDYGADINAVGDDGDMTPLMSAADDLGAAEMVEFLIAHGAELEMKDWCRGYTALMYAAASGSWDAFHVLLDAGADMYACNSRNDSTMGIAAAHRDVNLALCLRRHGWLAEKERVFPLVKAAAADSRQVAELLLEWGVPLEGRTEEGYTAFDMAVACGNLEMARFLLERGALGHAPGRPEGVMLHLAVQEGDAAAVLAELAAGADINKRLLPERRSALYRAVERRNAEMVRLLLAQGADVDGAASASYTPLYLAVSQKNTEMVNLLLDAGARAGVVSQGLWHSALDVAADAKSPELMRLLLARGAVGLEECKYTWLRKICSYRYNHTDVEMLTILLDAGVNPWLHWSGQFSIFDELRSDDMSEIACELRARGYEW